MGRVTVCFCVLAWAGGGAAQEAGKPASPQEAFAATAEAVKKKDWRGLVKHSSRDSQTVMAGAFILIAGMFAENGLAGEEHMKPIKTLMAQHGVKVDSGKEMMLKLGGVAGRNKEMAKMLKDMGQRIQNKPDWIANFLKIMEKVERGPIASGAFEEFNGALKDVQIDGKRARASVTGVMRGMERTEAIFFVVEDGVWKVDFLRMLEEKNFK